MDAGGGRILNPCPFPARSAFARSGDQTERDTRERAAVARHAFHLIEQPTEAIWVAGPFPVLAIMRIASTSSRLASGGG